MLRNIILGRPAVSILLWSYRWCVIRISHKWRWCIGPLTWRYYTSIWGLVYFDNVKRFPRRGVIKALLRCITNHIGSMNIRYGSWILLWDRSDIPGPLEWAIINAWPRSNFVRFDNRLTYQGIGLSVRGWHSMASSLIRDIRLSRILLHCNIVANGCVNRWLNYCVWG